MNEIFEKTKAALYAEAGSARPLRKMADFIIWALESGKHEDIAAGFTETDAKKKKTLAGCMTAVKSKAQKQASNGCAMIAEEEVYEWVAEWLGLSDCLTRAEIENYCHGGAALSAAPAQEEPPKPAGLDLGLDDLFG